MCVYILYVCFFLPTGAYIRLFDKTPKHRLHTWMNSQREECSVEQCARMCVLETRFKCQSFNYDARMQICRMTEYTEGQGYGVTSDVTIDFYERKNGTNIFLLAKFRLKLCEETWLGQILRVMALLCGFDDAFCF